MEDNTVNGGQASYPLTKRALWEFKDMLAGMAFPLIVMLVISSTIIVYASYAADLAVSLIALIGGEILIAGSLIVFGRANGDVAYKKTVLHGQKRSLGSTEPSVVCKTGEYALWKGAVIGAALCVPFLIMQIIELCYSNVVCSFCLQYMFGWAYFPFARLDKSLSALSFVMVILPIATHTLGYFLGKLKQIKAQQAAAARQAEKADKKGRRK